MSVKADGKNLTARTCTAKEWFDIRDEHEKDRDFNAALMATCIVDDKGNQAYTKETVENLTLPDWQKLEKLVAKANRADDDAGND